MSASASCSSSCAVTPCGIASKDFLARAQSALKLNASQLSLLTSLYSEALQQEAIESHCQRFMKSKKAACGRELKDGKCPTHGDDIFAPVDVPGEPVAVAKCPFVKKDGVVCDRNCAKGKNVCPLHIGKTMSSDMIACTFIVQSGERKGQACGKMFGKRDCPAEAGYDLSEYVLADDSINHYCTTHYDAEIKRRIKEAEKNKEEKKAKKEKKEKKSKKSEAEMKEESDPLDSDSDDEALFGSQEDEEEIDLPKKSAKPAKTYPQFDISLQESMTAAAIKVKGNETRLLRMKTKGQLYPIIFDRSIYEKEDGVIEIVGYTCDLVNKEIEESEFKQEWHPLMDEVVKFYNAREYKVRISSTLRK